MNRQMPSDLDRIVPWNEEFFYPEVEKEVDCGGE